MKRLFLLSLLLLGMGTLSSCNFSGSNPDQVFTRIGLNGNKIPRSFDRAFKEIQGQKAINRLVIYVDGKSQQATVSEYVDYHYKNLFDGDIKGIEELRVDEENKPIIDAGLDMFRYAEAIYKEDYPRIAKMMDEGRPEQEIQEAISHLDNTKGAELDEKRRQTMELLLPYADKHGVEYKKINMP